MMGMAEPIESIIMYFLLWEPWSISKRQSQHKFLDSTSNVFPGCVSALKKI